MTTGSDHKHSRAAGLITGGAAALFAASLAAGVLSGRMWWLVKPSYGPLLLATAALFAALGVARIVMCVRRVDAHAPESVAALLTIIAAALVAVAAVGPATGALAADRPLFAAASAPAARYPALPAPPEVPYVPLYQVAGRLIADRGSIDTREIRVIGQIEQVSDDHRWQLVRMQMNCCAADTQRTAIAGVGQRPGPPGAWIDATARASIQGAGSTAKPHLRLVSAKQVAAPRTPYEF